jgi:hypothetical protein
MGLKKEEVAVPDCSSNITEIIDFTEQDLSIRKKAPTETIICSLTHKQITLTFDINGVVTAKSGCEGCGSDRSY